jgi:protein phosphatase
MSDQNPTKHQDIETDPNLGIQEPQKPPAVTVQVEFGALSHPGKVRTHNEDHYVILKLSRNMQPLYTNVPENDLAGPFEEIGYGMVVADGMGGQAGGEVASRSAIQILLNLTASAPNWILKIDENEAQELMERASNYFQKVDSEISDKAKTEPALAGMGTTLTASYSIGSNVFIMNVGDSRAYLFRNGKLYQLTRDQTVAQALADAGQISPEDVANHPLRHVLTNAVGARGGNVSVDIQQMQLGHEDRLLLCSDGLTEMVDDNTISETMLRIQAPADCCQELVNLALQNGGKDNVTVLIARYLFS